MIFLIFVVVLKTGLEELQVFRNVLFVGEGMVQRHALLVDDHIVGLGVGAEFGTLQITPLVAVCAQRTFGAVGLLYFHGLGRGFLSSTIRVTST